MGILKSNLQKEKLGIEIFSNMFSLLWLLSLCFFLYNQELYLLYFLLQMQ